MLWYPMVGLLIGLMLMLMAWMLKAADSLVVSALLITAWVGMTGALHLDGLADSADAWLGSHGDKDRALEIMKDPACGPAGVVLIVLVLLLKFVTVLTLVESADYLVLLVVPMLARTMLPALFFTTKYVRKGGMALVMAEELVVQPVVLILIAVAVVVVALIGSQGVWLLAAAMLVGWWLRRLMIKHLGGTTGDTAGALVEITEMLVLLVAALLIRQ